MTKEERLKSEALRIRNMWEFEKSITGGFDFVFGIDEAGRGPLCGPVTAACCILPVDIDILYLNDSKKLSEKKREEVYEQVVKESLGYGIGMSSPERIDEINILNATLEAMKDAYDSCLKMLSEKGVPVDLMKDQSIVLIDGNKSAPGIKEHQITVVSGDAKCPSISAASCLAKVTRDRLLYEYDRMYPAYGFAHHKGYGTKEHIEALKSFGPLPIHRKTFIQKFV